VLPPHRNAGFSVAVEAHPSIFQFTVDKNCNVANLIEQLYL
jgi:hypothetical protein